MRVTVGSKNQTKVQAVANAFEESTLFESVEIVPVDVVTEEFGHPIGMSKVVEGAIDRAEQAYEEGDLGVGIEGGLIEVPGSKSGYMEVAACALFDGKRYHLGLSPAYEWPKPVVDLIVNNGLDGSQALKRAGFTSHEKLGTAEGGIWLFTHGKMNRTEFNKLAVVMALIHLENAEHY